MKNTIKLGISIILALSTSYAISAVSTDDLGGEIDIFTIFDTNKDGKISMEEITVGMFNMIKNDRDGDHYLSRDELVVTEDYQHFMAQFDFNKDGKLSMSEIPANMRDKMMKMDKNKDNFLTIDEITGETMPFTVR